MAFKEMKIRVLKEEDSERLQQLLFGLGYVWYGDSEAKVQLTSKRALFTDTDGKITCMSHADNYFDGHGYPEYSFRNGILYETGGEGEVVAVTYAPIDDTPVGPIIRPKADVDALHKAIDLQRLKELNTYLMHAVDNGQKVDTAVHFEFTQLLTSRLSYN